MTDKNEKDYRSLLMQALAEVEGKPLASDGESLDTYQDICYGCVLVAEKCLSEQDRLWEVADMARTCLHYASWLEEFDHKINALYVIMRRLSETVNDHPRLRLQVLNLFLTVLYRIEGQTGHDLGASEDVRREISRISSNIDFAERGEFDSIEDEGDLKKDPVEWTEKWEEVIDEAMRNALSRLEDTPRGMGFCYAYWHELKEALKHLGVEWRSPKTMNPGVMFD